jgi:actin-like ATPase involved in cell morphogenesis
MPNTVGKLRRQGRVLVGDETESLVKDPSQLLFVRPVERGVVVDPHVQAMLAVGR